MLPSGAMPGSCLYTQNTPLINLFVCVCKNDADHKNNAVCLPSVISIWVLLPLAHLHVAHRPRGGSVILFSHSTVGAWLHELFTSLNIKKKREKKFIVSPSSIRKKRF